jgi:thymidylate synthase (FAD)
MMLLLDHGYVAKIETWGSDERVIESARMSTNKGFQGWGPKDDGAPGDEKLLRYLYEHKHMTPFEMAGLTVEVQAPIFVFREWHRHRTQSVNELSARYTEIPELFYVPSENRLRNGGQSKTNKQGAGGEIDEATVNTFRTRIRTHAENSFVYYRQMLDMGVARELARLVLPVNTYSRMRASANLRNWLGFLTLRLDPAAQWEIRLYAQAVANIVADAFPRTFGLFNEKEAA